MSLAAAAVVVDIVVVVTSDEGTVAVAVLAEYATELEDPPGCAESTPEGFCATVEPVS